jgi:hypothetical protein
MNYQELTTAVMDAVENSFTEDQLALFCQQVEQKVYNVVQIPALRKNMVGNVSANVPFLSTPPDFLYVYSLAINDGVRQSFLLNKDTNYIQEAFPFPGATGLPRVYGIFDHNTLILGPTPAAPYEVQMTFGYYPESIVTAGTTWLGDNFDSVLLNGMLIEAGRFLRLEDNTMALYTKMFDEAMMLLKQLGDGKLRQDSYRSGQVRVPIR